MKLVLASRNRHKIEEIKRVLLDSGINKTVENPSVVIRIHGAFDIIVIQRYVVTDNNNSSIFIKRLVLRPFYKFGNLSVAASINVVILPFKIVLAEVTNITV